MLSIDIRELVLLVVEVAVLGLIPAALAAQTGRGFFRWWLYGSCCARDLYHCWVGADLHVFGLVS